MMIILAFCMLALSTIAWNEHTYYECFRDKSCEDGSICYAGTCTDSCPPGYKQSNRNYNTSDFTCECDAKMDFVEDGNFSSPFEFMPKCKCDKSPFCKVTIYAIGIGYTDGLIPKGLPPNCKVDKTDPNVLSTFSLLLIVLTMLIFLFIHCRSASSIIYDFHRYYGIYVFGSILVVVFTNTVTPFSAGFTRTMGFGVIAHNAAEWNLLLRLHFGKKAVVRNGANVCVTMYWVILLLSITFLPLEYFLYFAMLQGGFLDYVLLFFLVAGYRTIGPNDDANRDHFFSSCCLNVKSRFVFWYGGAAILHVLTVELLFAGFILNDAKLIGAGGFLLLPSFLFYLIWVYGQERFMLCLGPSVFYNYNEHYKRGEETQLLVPFTHTSLAADVIYHDLVGSIKKTDVAMTEKKLDQVWIDKQEVEDVEDGQEEIIMMNHFQKFIVEDCETFKVGVHEVARKCPCNCRCCSWIPIYWYAGFVCITVNVIIFVQLPSYIDRSGCSDGYDYGAW